MSSSRSALSRSTGARSGSSSTPKGSASKKSLFAQEQDRPDVARRREQWRRYQGRIDPSRLVFIDETWAKTNMTPLRGWCQRGARLKAKAPFGRWKTMTFIAALRCDRIDAPCLIAGRFNAEASVSWVDTFLVPTMKAGDVVI